MVITPFFSLRSAINICFLFEVAGPSALAESIRGALTSAPASPRSVMKGMAPVTLHVETFGMVKK